MFYFCYDKKKNKKIGIKNFNNVFFYYNAGEIFDPEIDIDEIYNRVKNNDINDFLGEYNYFFEDDENIFIFSDELGTIKWFYYYKEGKFIISNNIWSIANDLQLGIEDINQESFYESMLFYFPLNNKTFFKDIMVLPQGSLMIFSKKSNKLIINKIKKIEYKEKKLSKEEWFYHIDKAFKKNIDKIKIFNKKLYLGISISGGLDSRFSLLYSNTIAKRIGFLLGIKNNFLKPLDLLSAEKLANYFNVKLKLINPFNNINIKEKLLIDILRNPIGPSNFLKAINKQKSFTKQENFNVLLTGAYGGLVGGRILNDDLIYSSDKDLSNKMFYFYSTFTKLNKIKKGKAYLTFFYTSLQRFLLYLGVLHEKEINFKDEINNFLNDDFLIPIKYKKNIYMKFTSIFNKNSNNVSKIMTFHLYRHSIRGAFESLHGQVKAYSIYYPYIFELSKQWNVEYLKGRKLIEEFLLWKNKEISNINLQSFNLPITFKYQKKKTYKTVQFIYKFFSFISFIMRRLVITYNKWWNKKEVTLFVDTIINDNVKSFNQIFESQDVKRLLTYKRYDLLLEHMVKIKYILKIIENKNYQELLNLKIDESLKY